MTLKTGRRPAKQAPALLLADVLSGSVPAHPTSQDNFTPLNGGWNMLGNDQYGDCVAVTAANVRRLMTNGAKYADLAQVEEFYKTQNPNFPADDNGMEIQTALEELAKNGDKYFDGVKAVAFAKVDHTNADEVKAAISIFGYVWTGIVVYANNMNEFDAGQPWDYQPGSSVDGGHSIVTGGYDGDGVGGDEKFITWAQETSFTDSFWSHAVEEAWVVIWPEHFTTAQFQEGIDVSKLASAYQALTGRTLPVPTPPAPVPTPTPTPTPAPTPAPGPADEEDLVLWDAVRKWVGGRHCCKTTAVAKALRVWAAEKDLS